MQDRISPYFYAVGKDWKNGPRNLKTMKASSNQKTFIQSVLKLSIIAI